MRRLLLAAAVLTVAAGPAPVTDAKVRDLIARQQRAWNAGDLKTYFAAYTPDAVFVDQARSNENTIVPYGRSALAQARANSRKALAKGKLSENGQVVRVEVSPDGRSARAAINVVLRAPSAGGQRTSCVQRLQTFVARGARLVSTGQTDTIVRCRR